jgi:uncharacterized protein YraI
MGRATLGGSGWEVPPVTEAALAASVTADTLVKTGAGILYGIEVTTALSGATVVIRDSLTAGAGTVLCTIPASSAIGYQKHFFGVGVGFSAGLYADFGGTGTITLLYT